MAAPNLQGTLVIVVLKARNLKDKHSFYKQDAFAQLSISGESKKTQVDVKGGQHPVWDTELRFPIFEVAEESSKSREKHRLLEVSCWAKEPRVDEMIAQAKLDIEETLRTGEFDDWIPLTEPSGAQRGEIYLEMTYFSNALPPPAPVTPPLNLKSKYGAGSHGPHFSAHIASDMNAPLQRRPSKFTPAERLSRPSPPASLMPNRPSPPSHIHNDHATHSSRLSPSEPVSNRPTSNQPPSRVRTPDDAKPAQTHVPTILRPGNRKSDFLSRPSAAAQGESGHESTHTANLHSHRSSQSFGDSQSNLPYNGYAQALSPSHIPVTSHPASHPSTPVPSHYANLSSSRYDNHPATAPSSPPMFPVPNLQPANESIGRAVSDLPDPYLIARYQTPLPLPPDSSGIIKQRTSHLPVEPSGSNEPDRFRLEALKKEEEELWKRKEQEDRDLEIARQLDRELNLGGG